MTPDRVWVVSAYYCEEGDVECVCASLEAARKRAASLHECEWVPQSSDEFPGREWMANTIRHVQIDAFEVER